MPNLVWNPKTVPQAFENPNIDKIYSILNNYYTEYGEFASEEEAFFYTNGELGGLMEVEIVRNYVNEWWNS